MNLEKEWRIKMKKKILSLIICVSVLCTHTLTLFAEERRIERSDIVALHKDVPLNEAVKDTGFGMLKNYLSLDSAIPRAATWEVWGERESIPVFDTPSGAYKYMKRPIGYSRLVSNGSVVSKRHYTRTFVLLSGQYKGDSGRKWGYETVKAEGTVCDDDVWSAGQHQVWYGTTES